MTVAPETADVVRALERNGVADVDAGPLARALYSTDASLYRVVPQVVVRPRDVDEVIATMAACAATGVPLTARGAGTSIAGNAVGTGVVMDLRRHLDAVTSIDAEARTAVVEPGVVHARLQRAATPHGLRFGPDPSTHPRCTIGGMIGNNACGSRALGYGRTADNVLGLDLLSADGTRLSVGAGAGAGAGAGPVPDVPLLAELRALAGANLGTIRPEFGRFGRQVSGYSLEHLLPERGFDVARFMAGTEGTLAVVLGATVRLVRDPPYRHLLALGYPDMASAADDVMTALEFGPIACEGLDARIVEVMIAQHGPGAVPQLPAGRGWLFVELAGDHDGEILDRATRLAAASTALDSRLVSDLSEQAALWRIREEGAGLAARALSRPALSGWEDAAVPPERLGAYLREFDELLRGYDLDGVPYGHFGDGCIHCRIDFPLEAAGGQQLYRDFIFDAARLVAAHGGSLSGEHGDGRARSELLPIMYSAAAVELFGRVKGIFDPGNLLNPGVLVEPRALDDDLRRSAARSPALARGGRPGLRLLHDGGDLGTAVHRCTGVGKCVADSLGGTGVMCPSFQATRDEKDSTRGRARVLQEMMDGRLVSGGWRSPEVHQALDLCLSCKGCLNDCPTGIDMASYKAEVLHRTYQGRLRPRSHYVLGRLPVLARLTSPFAAVANLLLNLPGLATVLRWAAGVDQRRSLPAFATSRFRRWSRAHEPAGGSADGSAGGSGRPRVLLWADTFTEFFTTGQGRAAVAVLEAAGYRVEFPTRTACCGLTWISTGQLQVARKKVTDTVDLLHPYALAGVPVVGLEPSCLSVLRHDAADLVDQAHAGRAAQVAANAFTLAELLSRTPGWRPPDLTGTEIVVQPHCHQASVLGFGADMSVLDSTGARVTRLGGCCGLAGNFGVEKGHYEVSVAVARQQLLPAVEAAGADAVILADGFSCRTQLDDLAGRKAVHLAELLAGS